MQCLSVTWITRFPTRYTPTTCKFPYICVAPRTLTYKEKFPEARAVGQCTEFCEREVEREHRKGINADNNKNNNNNNNNNNNISFGEERTDSTVAIKVVAVLFFWN